MAAQGGSATITAGESEKVVAHGVGSTPTLVLITHQDNPNGRDSKVDPSRVDGTNLYIEIDSPDLVDHGFYWYAV